VRCDESVDARSHLAKRSASGYTCERLPMSARNSQLRFPKLAVALSISQVAGQRPDPSMTARSDHRVEQECQRPFERPRVRSVSRIGNAAQFAASTAASPRLVPAGFHDAISPRSSFGQRFISGDSLRAATHAQLLHRRASKAWRRAVQAVPPVTRLDDAEQCGKRRIGGIVLIADASHNRPVPADGAMASTTNKYSLMK